MRRVLESEENRFLQSVKEDISGASEEDSQGKAVYFIIGLSIATIVVSIFTFALSMSKDSQIASLDAQIEEQVTTPLNNLAKERKQVTAISSQLEVLNTALSGRTKYALLVKDLATNTYNQSRWTGIDYTQEKIVLSGSADDFLGVSKAVSAFEGFGSVESVNLTSVNIEEESSAVEYVLELEVNQEGYKLVSKKVSNIQSNELEQNAGR